MCLFPLDCCRRFACDIVHHEVYLIGELCIYFACYIGESAFVKIPAGNGGSCRHEVTRDNSTDGDAVFCSVCGNREQNGKCLAYLLCRKFRRDYSVKLTQQIG